MKSKRVVRGASWGLLLVAACEPSIVEPIGGGPNEVSSSGNAGQSVGFAGRGGGLGGFGNAGSGTSGGGSVETGSARAGSAGEIIGSAGAGACVGSLSEVVAAEWGDCPPLLCDALVAVEDSARVPAGALTQVGVCGMLRSITVDYGTHGKTCYYPLVGGDSKLVGAAAWDDTPRYCDGTSSRIVAGKIAGDCMNRNESATVCDYSSSPGDASGGADGGAGFGSGGAPPNVAPTTCQNAFSNSCEPCCPTEPPDCTDKPNGYPGFGHDYGCTQGPNSFCSCGCVSERWVCGC